MNQIEGYIRTNLDDAKKVADALKDGPVMFSWTDEKTHFDFYMVPSRYFETVFLAPQKIMNWRWHGMVIVSIERKGCFNFDLMSGEQSFYPGYISEKLGLDKDGSDSESVCEFLNMISITYKSRRNIIL